MNGWEGEQTGAQVSQAGGAQVTEGNSQVHTRVYTPR